MTLLVCSLLLSVALITIVPQQNAMALELLPSDINVDLHKEFTLGQITLPAGLLQDLIPLVHSAQARGEGVFKRGTYTYPIGSSNLSITFLKETPFKGSIALPLEGKYPIILDNLSFNVDLQRRDTAVVKYGMIRGAITNVRLANGVLTFRIALLETILRNIIPPTWVPSDDNPMPFEDFTITSGKLEMEKDSIATTSALTLNPHRGRITTSNLHLNQKADLTGIVSIDADLGARTSLRFGQVTLNSGHSVLASDLVMDKHGSFLRFGIPSASGRACDQIAMYDVNLKTADSSVAVAAKKVLLKQTIFGCSVDQNDSDLTIQSFLTLSDALVTYKSGSETLNCASTSIPVLLDVHNTNKSSVWKLNQSANFKIDSIDYKHTSGADNFAISNGQAQVSQIAISNSTSGTDPPLFVTSGDCVFTRAALSCSVSGKDSSAMVSPGAHVVMHIASGKEFGIRVELPGILALNNVVVNLANNHVELASLTFNDSRIDGSDFDTAIRTSRFSLRPTAGTFVTSGKSLQCSFRDSIITSGSSTSLVIPIGKDLVVSRIVLDLSCQQIGVAEGNDQYFLANIGRMGRTSEIVIQPTQPVTFDLRQFDCVFSYAGPSSSVSNINCKIDEAIIVLSVSGTTVDTKGFHVLVPGFLLTKLIRDALPDHQDNTPASGTDLKKIWGGFLLDVEASRNCRTWGFKNNVWLRASRKNRIEFGFTFYGNLYADASSFGFPDGGMTFDPYKSDVTATIDLSTNPQNCKTLHFSVTPGANTNYIHYSDWGVLHGKKNDFLDGISSQAKDQVSKQVSSVLAPDMDANELCDKVPASNPKLRAIVKSLRLTDLSILPNWSGPEFVLTGSLVIP